MKHGARGIYREGNLTPIEQSSKWRDFPFEFPWIRRTKQGDKGSCRRLM